MSSALPQLRPMTAGDVLDTAIRIYRQNFVRLVGIVAIVHVPVLLISVIGLALTFPLTTTFSNFQNFPTASSSPLFWVGYIIQFVGGIIGAIATLFENGALTAFVSERFLERPITIREAYGRAFQRWLALLLAAFLLFVVYIVLFGVFFGVIFVPLFGLSALGSSNSGGVSAVAGALVLCFCVLIIPAILFGIFLYTRWAFFIQAIVLENYNSTGGLGRSWKLVKGSFWRVFLLLAVLVIMVGILSAGPTYLFTTLSFALGAIGLAFIASTVVSSLVVMIFTPLQYAALTILYYDLRIRKEGFDLQMQLQSVDAAPDLPSLTSGATAG